MATRMAVRYVTRRFSSDGKVLGEEERAAENVYIKKIEKEKLEKLARKQLISYDDHRFSKGPKPEETPASGSGGPGSVSDANPGAGTSASSTRVSTDKYRNYAVVAGVVTGLSALGWYLMSKEKKSKEVQD